MSKMKIDWYTRPASDHQKDIILEGFKRYLRNIGLHGVTIKLYLGRVRAFLEFANSHNPDIAIANKYRNMLIDKGLSRSHLNNTCFAMKKFYKMNDVEWDFTILRSNDAIPYYFDEKDVSAIFSVCANIKHLAMLQTLFYGCLRSSELCKLDDSDLNMSTRTVLLRETKNGSDGLACISSECAETLRLYLKIRPQVKIGDRIPLFYTDNLNSWSKNDVHRMFLSYKKKARIDKPGAVYVFSRHTPATIMVAKGCDIRIVKKVLRHRDIRTTLRYAHVSDKTKRERISANSQRGCPLQSIKTTITFI